MRPLASVCNGTRQKRAYLELTLAGLRAQTAPPPEVWEQYHRLRQLPEYAALAEAIEEVGHTRLED